MEHHAPNTDHWTGFAVSQHKNLRTRKMMRAMVKTITDYKLIEENDHILVAVSGGKDSYALVDLLFQAQKKAPFFFQITAVHIDQVQPGYDGRPLVDWLKKHEIPHRIIQEDTYSVVIDKLKPGSTYCSLCSRLRRGILYRIAKELSCNKIALGHHRDDGLETLFLNLFYAGKLQAMPPKYATDDGQFWVIRPLIDIPESELIAHAERMKYPILPCNLCGSQEGLKRERMRELLDSLSQEIPDVRSVMHHALKNVQKSHLLDARYLDTEMNRLSRQNTGTSNPAFACRKLPII